MSKRDSPDTADPVQAPEEHGDSQGPSATGAALARSMWENVRSGAAHFEQRELPPPGHPVRQFVHGMCLPFHLARALWAEPAARRRFVRVGLIQSIVIVALTLTFHNSGKEAVRTVKGRDREAEQPQQAEQVKPKDTPPSTSFKADVERFKLEVKAVAEEVRQKAEEAAEQERAARGDEDDAASDEDGQESGKPGKEPQGFLAVISRQWAFWAGLIAALQVAQWIVIALSRDFHDAISRDASLLTGVEPEDPPLRPRIRLDMKWLRSKFSRRMRALKVFLVGMPLFYALVAPMPFRHELLSVLASLWSAYWLVVFTTAKSAQAWSNGDAREPWFLRGWSYLTTRVPGFRWGFLQGYGRFWATQTRGVFSPAVETEKQPWAFAGLALTRMLSMLPLVKCFLRPLVPVASAHLISARRAADRAGA